MRQIRPNNILKLFNVRIGILGKSNEALRHMNINNQDLFKQQT